MTFAVIVEPEAKADLLRLYDFLLQRAECVEDLEFADRALQVIDVAMASLATTPERVVVLAVRHQHEADSH